MNDLDKLSQMANNNQNIRMSTSLVRADKVKAGGHITMGIDGETLMELVLHPEKYMVALYVIDREQFNAIKDE